MKEILQLFRRDAEHAAPTSNDLKAYDLGQKPRILKEREPVGAASVNLNDVRRERKATPPSRIGSRADEDSVYGRRW
jgi:hypothetical protein